MNWTTPGDLRTQVERLWERGELPRAVVGGTIPWPLRLGLKGPTPSELTDHFDSVRAWVAALAETPHVRVEWQERRHRVHGLQRLPSAVWVDTLEDAMAIAAKRREAQRLRALWERTGSDLPGLLPWLARCPLQALDLEDRWSKLLAVVHWVMSHPRSDVYLRQVDVPGVDSKFIEAHRAVLTELLDLVLPTSEIDESARGVNQFSRRYGFREKPIRVRFRVLDTTVTAMPGCTGLIDVSLDADVFATLKLPIERVFITENETNFLAFPALRRAIVIFGAGYGWEALARATWLRECQVHYWGDIDTHGFAILDHLRAVLPTATSMLMDRATLFAHEAHWGEEPDPVRHDLSRLFENEQALYGELRIGCIRPRLRLEQERIGYGWFLQYVTKLDGACR